MKSYALTPDVQLAIAEACWRERLRLTLTHKEMA